MQLTQSVIFGADKLPMCHGMHRSQNTIDLRVFIHYHNNQRYYGAMGYSDSYLEIFVFPGEMEMAVGIETKTKGNTKQN